jgi:hypothetical protein
MSLVNPNGELALRGDYDPHQLKTHIELARTHEAVIAEKLRRGGDHYIEPSALLEIDCALFGRPVLRAVGTDPEIVTELPAHEGENQTI